MLNFDFTKRKTKRIYFCLLMLIAAVAAAFFAAAAAEKSGRYWAGFDGKRAEASPIDNDGFVMVDVSDLSSADEPDEQKKEEEETEAVPIGVGTVPNVPSLTNQELKLYSVLSRNDGLLISADKQDLNEDIHWQEVVLEPGDTVKSIADEYGVAPLDIIKANGLDPKQKLEAAEIIYVPDGHEYVGVTHNYVAMMKKSEQILAKGGAPLSVTAYIVQKGDTLWSVANRFSLDVDTIIGSNKLKNISSIKPGVTLRIPNQDGIFIKVAPGDTISELADKYGSFPKAIATANKLHMDADLRIGKEIFLPGASIVAVAETVPAKGSRKLVRAATARIIRQVARSSGVSRHFRWPVMGQISSSFGWRRSPFGRRRVFHAGLDIRAPRGRPIIAAGDGVVVHSGWMSGYGKAIVISHGGGVSTLYGHCSSLAVGNGRSVSRGQVVGFVGSTGRSTGNHCHFEVRRGGRAVNPLSSLR